MNDMVRTILAQDAVYGRLTYDGFDLPFRKTGSGRDLLVCGTAIQRDRLQKIEMVNALLDCVVDCLNAISS